METGKNKTRSISRFVLRVVIVAAIGFMCAAVVPQTASAQHRVVTVRTFYNELRPYGRWINYPRYGRLWMPAVEPGFSPYATGGHWEDTEYGLAWVSDYPWGWAAFHYGRWLFDPAYGWLWMPGTEWAPAWVVWSQADDYYGWAPIPPGYGFSVNIGLIPADRWYFVRDNYIIDRHVNRYFINRSYNRRLMHDARAIHNFEGHRRHDEEHGRDNGSMNNPERKEMQYVSPDRGSSRRTSRGRMEYVPQQNPGGEVIQQNNSVPNNNTAPATEGRGRGVEKHSMPSQPAGGNGGGGNRGNDRQQPQRKQMPDNGGGRK